MKLPSISLNSLQEWKELKRFQELDEKNKSIVFYSENEFNKKITKQIDSNQFMNVWQRPKP